MTAPSKPWEGMCVGGRTNSNMQNITDSGGLQSSLPTIANPTMPVGGPMPSGIPTVVPHGTLRRVMRTVPAPPPRPYRTMRATYGSQYGSYGTGYGTGYGMGSYGTGYGGVGYGGYGGYGGTYGINRYGYNNYNYLPGNDPESRFIQMAEESSRPAFQSIESLVHAVGSVSFMLESTFNAMYSSFRAVLGVAENFGRLRTLFGQFFSTFAALRALQWLYKKLLYILGLRKVNPGREEIWQQAAAGVGGLPAGIDTKEARSSWPILMFMGILCSGPYLVWKLVNSINSATALNVYDPKDWKMAKEPVYVAVALFDFVAESPQEHSFKAGQLLHIAPKDLQPKDSKDWILAVLPPRNSVKYIPSNYVKIKYVSGLSSPDILAGYAKERSPHPRGVENGAQAASVSFPSQRTGLSSNEQTEKTSLSIPNIIPNQTTVPSDLTAEWNPGELESEGTELLPETTVSNQEISVLPEELVPVESKKNEVSIS